MTITYTCDKCGETGATTGAVTVVNGVGTFYRGRLSYHFDKNSFELCQGCAYIVRKFLVKQPTDEEVRSYLEEKETIEGKRHGDTLTSTFD